MPTPQHRAREEGIYGPLMVPSPFRTPQELAKAQDKILEGYTVTCADDGLGASFDPMQCSDDCLKYARAQKNLRETTETDRRFIRLQILCDALGFFRGGRMATRFGMRCMDLMRV